MVEKTTDFTMLVLFSMGITKGKWGTLLNALLDFQRDYDSNAPLEQVPAGAGARTRPKPTPASACAISPTDVRGHAATCGTTRLMGEAYRGPADPDHAAGARPIEELVRGNVERVTLDQLAGRTAATGVVPYPPGIPMLMPGEQAGADDGPIIGYLRALEQYDALFPGFGHDTHGIEVEDGVATLLVLKETS